MTGQNAILSVSFLNIIITKEESICVNYGLELPDAEKAPYMEIYRKNL